MTDEDYPALFRSANATAGSDQSWYLWLIRIEYFLLFVASVFSMEIFTGPVFYGCYALVFVGSIVTLLTRTQMKPEQNWYRNRALAESVKTLTWRYMMKSAPFHHNAPKLAHAEFRDALRKSFEDSRASNGTISPRFSSEHQITTEMERIRELSLIERIGYYRTNRIDNQHNWYADKAGRNKLMARLWLLLAVILYVMASGLVIARIIYAEIRFWPIEPVIVLAASIVGWAQIKKFNELSAAYTITAHEIGMIKSTLQDVDDEEKFSELINEAELAFSREHTLWIARQ